MWRKCRNCHARKPGVTGTPPLCRLCRELAKMPP